MSIVNFADIVEPNGKTIRENNLERKHAIPISTLVEVKYDTWHGDGACEKVHARLFVLLHTRDCDGTPLYTLGRHPPSADPEWVKPEDLLGLSFSPRHLLAESWYGAKHHMGEEGLVPVEVTPALIRGDDTLRWPDDTETP